MLYVLKGENGKRYVGITSDLTRRPRDHSHGKPKGGYEIPLNRHFYRYNPPRELTDIEAEIKGLKGEILELLKEVTA
ncbi:MAG: GIY-YIG nuclease family protein [Pseudomonadota bacterium]